MLSAAFSIATVRAADVNVAAGASDTRAKTVSGTDTVTVGAGGSLSVNKKIAVEWNDASSNLKIKNSGTIESTRANGRAIDTTGNDNNRTLTLDNKKDAVITSDNDAVRISVNPTGGTITVNNAGTIKSTIGRALDFDKAASGAATITINNAATGAIKSNGDDAIRPGQGATINNSGSIYADGDPGTKNDGIDFKDNTAGTVNNNDSGTISGARHGVTLGGGGTGSVTATNAAGATITGRSGSGVGSDSRGTVTNYGTIEGAYSGDGSQDGDGDGVDIDFAGTITNYGTIKGTGAGGYDSHGRANNSEGISLGGGTITNSGTISGASYGIVVNNDSNGDNSRSGVAATTITNDVGGTIEGKGGYAIRLENKLGTAADNDTIVNKGTIIGNGALPDPTLVVHLRDGTVDGGSVGTLDGVRYTGTGSARFIRGDGAAIQMGEGNDVLTNYGTITGNSGRAVSLEGGNDTLNLYTGSSITGRIDGGTGTDTINLDKESGGPDGGTLANVINFETLTVKGGTWKLLDDQTYANGATIAAGATLRVGDGATAGSITAGIANNGALVFDRTDATSYAGTISGTGSLTKVNTGTLTLSTAHSYTGTTTVSGGVLNIRNAAALGSADGTAATGTTVASGAALELQGGIAVGNEALSLAGYGVSNGGALRSVSGNNSVAGAITLTDDSRINADTGTLTLSGGISGAAGANRILTLGGAGDGIVSGAIAGNLDFLVKDGAGTWALKGQSALGKALQIDGGALRLEAGGGLSSASGYVGTWNASTGSAIVTGAGSRWTLNRILAVGYQGTGTVTVAAGGTVLVGTNGTGTVSVADQAGSTGTLAIGAAAGQVAVAAGTVSAGEVHFGSGTGTLVFNHTGNPDGTAFTFAPRITGAGSLSQLAGTTILTGANTYTGATTVSAGTLSAAIATALGTSATTVAAGGTLDVNGVTIGNALTLSGTGAGGVGALTGTGTAGVSGAVTLAGNAALGGIGTLTVSGAIGDGGNGYGLTKLGSGTAILTAANTYTGATTVAAGTLALSGAGSIAGSSRVALATGATFDIAGLAGTGTTITDLADAAAGQAGTVALGAKHMTVSNAAGRFGGSITGTGGLTLAGGTLTLSGTSTYSGGTTLAGGTLRILSDAGLGDASGPLTFGGGALATTASLATARAVTLDAGGGTVAPGAGTVLTASGTISGGGSLAVAGPGTLTLTGASTYTGATTISPGATLRLGDGGSAGTIAATSGVTDDGTLVVDRADLARFAPAISGSGGLTQAGSGTTVLTGRNSYTGATTVAAGTLQIDGVLTASDVTVKRGGTLSGSGKIGDPLIEAGGRLAPGSASAIGTLSIHGPLTFAPGSFYTVKVTPTANDRTAVTGPVTIQGGTVQVQAGAGTYTPSLRYTLLTATGGITGAFTGLQTTGNLAFLTPSLVYDRSSVALAFAQTAPLASAATTTNQGGVALALNGVGPTVTTTTVSSPTPAVTTRVSSNGTVTTTVGTESGTTTVVSSPAAQVATAVLNQTAAGAVRALNSLSGEIQASTMATQAQTAFAVQDVLLERLRSGGGSGLTGTVGQMFAPGTTLPAGYAALTPDEPADTGLLHVSPPAPRYGLWGQAFGAFGSTDATRNAGRLTRAVGGFVLGAETGRGVLDEVLGSGLAGWRAGVAGGYSVTQFDMSARQSSGRIEGSFGAAYLSGALGPVQVRLGTVYGSDALDTHRTVLFPGFSQAIGGRTGGTALQSFGEVGHRIDGAAGYVEPFVGAAALRLHRTGFTETGGSAALVTFGRSYLIETVTAGVQAQAIVADLSGGGGALRVQGLIGYRQAFGDVTPAALMAFRGGGTAFRTGGGRWLGMRPWCRRVWTGTWRRARGWAWPMTVSSAAGRRITPSRAASPITGERARALNRAVGQAATVQGRARGVGAQRRPFVGIVASLALSETNKIRARNLDPTSEP